MHKRRNYLLFTLGTMLAAAAAGMLIFTALGRGPVSALVLSFLWWGALHSAGWGVAGTLFPRQLLAWRASYMRDIQGWDRRLGDWVDDRLQPESPAGVRRVRRIGMMNLTVAAVIAALAAVVSAGAVPGLFNALGG